MKLTDTQVKQYVEAYKEPWDQQRWNLKQWMFARRHIRAPYHPAYYQPVIGCRWTKRYWVSQVVNEAYEEYMKWTSSLPANGSGSSSSLGS